jgi:hypothetical protein
MVPRSAKPLEAIASGASHVQSTAFGQPSRPFLGARGPAPKLGQCEPEDEHEQQPDQAEIEIEMARL